MNRRSANIKRLSFRGLMLWMLAALLASATSVSAQSWSIQLSDFSARSGEILSADDKGVRLRAAGSEETLSLDQFLQADRGDSVRAQGARFVLHLTSGDTVAGEPNGIRGESLAWRHPLAGEMEFPLREITEMTRGGATASAGNAPAEDTVTLANGDVVSGVLSNLSPSKLAIASPDDVEVPMDSVQIVRFANTSAVRGSTARQFRLRVVPESMLTVDAFSLDARRVTATVNGRKIDFDRAALVGIEQINGPVSWLSSRPPSENLHTPYLSLAFPPQMDRTVSGDPIRAGGRTFARGIGVHAYSRMTWPLDGAYQTLRLQYVIDGDRPHADVHVRILLDGKLIHEAASFRSGPPSEVLSFDIAQSKSVTLEVDFGAGLDVQDRFVWIEPALLRSPPSTRPAN